MKTIWLFILMIGGITQLKAQQLTTTPSVKKPNILIPVPFVPNTLQPLPGVPNSNKVIAVDITDRMPVARVQSTDRMPVVKTDEPNMHYTMLIKRLTEAKPDSLVKTVRP